MCPAGGLTLAGSPRCPIRWRRIVRPDGVSRVLLNATVGTAAELIVGFVSLKPGYSDMVRAALIGAVPFFMLPAK